MVMDIVRMDIVWNMDNNMLTVANKGRENIYKKKQKKNIENKTEEKDMIQEEEYICTNGL